MTQTITVSENKFNQLITTISELKDEVAKLAQKLEATEEPPYGSDEWWKWSIKKGEEDIKAGRYTTIKNKKELKVFFDNL